jgi:magnesium-protoporphyrin O-methyltransferase
MTDTTQHKDKLLAYFDGIGFERWSAIYGHSELSRVRRTIRDGHARMLTLAEMWLVEGLETSDLRRVERGSKSPASGLQPHVLDAGCGTGLFSIALARRGFDVHAVDIAPQMVGAAERQAAAAGVHTQIDFSVGDLEAIDGTYDAVVCFDVLIHYPQASFAQLCARLARLSRGPLLLTYAPREPVLAALHWLGGRFPRSQRRTDIQMLPRAWVHQTLAASGMHVRREERISRGFYHVSLVEAGR